MKMGELYKQNKVDLNTTLSIGDQIKVDDIARYEWEQGVNWGLVIGGAGSIILGVFELFRQKYKKVKK
jgi:hypothetical protein